MSDDSSDSGSVHSGGSLKTKKQPSQESIGNPLYCSYVEGVYTYKDPNTKNEFTWEETTQAWIPKIFNGRPVLRNPETLIFEYTDSDGTIFEFDTKKNAWFPKSSKTRGEAGLLAASLPSASSAPKPSGSSASSSSALIESEENIPEGGFTNPNYSGPRRFYYAALSPESMGVEYLSPDDQMNNNSEPASEDPFQHEPGGGAVGGPGNGHLQPSSSGGGAAASSLPPGWERHEDSKGPYFWHIKSGTIQREPPPNPGALNIPGQLNPSSNNHSSTGMSTSFSCYNVLQQSQSTNQNTSSTSKPKGTKPPPPTFLDNKQVEEEREKHQVSSGSASNWAHFLDRSQSSSSSSSSPSSNNSIRFIAVSLGFLPICEEDLTPERSSKAVSRVINELTSSKAESAGKIWNTLSEIYLELDESHLRVRNDKMIIQEQPIHSIRVWGVGREDTRDFAFVAREKKTRQFLCHVFRLETNARPLASALRDACKKIMIERQKKNKRPDSLPMGSLMKKSNSTIASGGGGLTAESFPTPMDEPRKIIKASYLGSKLVSKPAGIELLNMAIDNCLNDEKIPVSVSVAPSVIQITSEDPIRPLNLEIRVRFLSFMGIGTDVRTCGVIVHTAHDSFEAHCFFSNPSSGALCKAIEAACVLRYQKCLDSHHRSDSVESGPGAGSSSAASTGPAFNITSPTASLANALKNVLGVFTRRNSSEDK